LLLVTSFFLLTLNKTVLHAGAVSEQFGSRHLLCLYPAKTAWLETDLVRGMMRAERTRWNI